MEKIRNNASFVLLVALFVFLPFSSWLVSLSGNPWVSLIRDILVGLLALLASINIINLKKPALIIALLFIIYGFLSYFWRSSSVEQWLRGFRFYFFPIIFFLAISLINFSKIQKKTLLWILFGGFVFISAIAILESFGIRIPVSRGENIVGALEQFQGLGGSIARLQSILAGPNALGLYLVAISGLLLSAFLLINKKLIYLLPIPLAMVVLTFSRSALIGMFVLCLFSLLIFLSRKYSALIASSFAVFIIAIIIIVGIKMYKSDQYTYFITHGASTSLRTEQVKRIWNSKEEIGLLGRGVGTAGPSSHNRLDGGPNHWSENIYLDTFEELGLVGLVLFLLLIIFIYKKTALELSAPINKGAILIMTSFLIMGLFINIYTGQIGIYILYLMAGLSGKENDDKSSN